MCCIFFTFSSSSHVLVLASNRDEYLARPTANAHFHNFEQTRHTAKDESAAFRSLSSPSASAPILSGLDTHPNGGGTWLGLNAATGRWAALTNFTESAPPKLPLAHKPHVTEYKSRGFLVKEWLKIPAESDKSAAAYAQEVGSTRDELAGFNLLVGRLPSAAEGRPNSLAYVTNRNHSGTAGRESTDVYERSPVDGMSGQVHILLPLPFDREQSGHEWENACPVASSSAFGPVTSSHSMCSNGELPDEHLRSQGLSNSVLSEPWCKVNSGRRTFDSILDAYDSTTSRPQSRDATLINPLFNLLRQTPPHLDPLQGGTGIRNVVDARCTICVPLYSRSQAQRQQEVAPEEISDWYGTRTSTVLIVDRPEPAIGKAKVTFVERDVHVQERGQGPRRLTAEEQAKSERRHEFYLP